MLEWALSNPFVPVVALAAAASAAFAVLIAFSRIGFLGAVGAPVAFLVAYYATYQKVPPFPPSGAANKVFYVGAIAAVVALALEAVPRVPAVAKAGLAALFAALWIGASQWGRADPGFVAGSAALVLGGGFALWLTLRQNREAGGAAALAMAAALAVNLAPVVLFGGSSTGVGLCVGAAAALALLSTVYLKLRLPDAALLGVGAGLIALAATLALVSRQADLPALALVALSPLPGRIVLARLRLAPFWAWIASGLATLSPLAAIVALLFWRHESPL